MSGRRDESIAQLEQQLDGASRTMSALDRLNAREAERVAARMDRLASQLLEISEPPAMEAVYERLEVTPATSASDAKSSSLSPARRRAASERPYAFDFQLTQALDGTLVWTFVGLRPPPSEARCPKRLRTRAPLAPRSIP
jgi:hypothetical protein